MGMNSQLAKTMRILYKKDSKGKTRVLRIWTEGSEIVQESGLLHGNLVTNRSQCEGKNIGKINETTGAEQAISEMESKITLKLREGYVENIDDIQEADEILLPMLAQDYKKHASKINWNYLVYTQPKLDGMRCLAVIKNGQVTLWSRGGKEITTCDHIVKDLIGLEDQILDGELYAHGVSFQENMRLIKKYRNGETEKVKYHVYDMVENGQISQRITQIITLISSNTFKHVIEVPSVVIQSEQDLKSNHSRYLSEGYEGTIIRWGMASYEVNKRSYSLLKYKDFIDEVYEIVDIISSEKRPEHGVVVCKTNFVNGLASVSFKANPKMSHEDREELLRLKHEYIGKMAEIRFFEYTDDGIPRFPIMVGIRLDK